jgi:hypothetical protein
VWGRIDETPLHNLKSNTVLNNAVLNCMASASAHCQSCVFSVIRKCNRTIDSFRASSRRVVTGLVLAPNIKIADHELNRISQSISNDPRESVRVQRDTRMTDRQWTIAITTFVAIGETEHTFVLSSD